MKLTIDNFEKTLSAATQKKALDFFTKSKVDELEQNNDKWVAFVRGKDQDFDVSVTLKSKALLGHSCDCASEEEICEHVGAVLYAVQTHSEGASTTKKASKTPKKVVEKPEKPAKPKKPETFAQLLEKVSADDLRSFLQENYARDKHFKSLFMARFMASSSSSTGGNVTQYMTLVENTLKIGFDRSGYADWQSLKKLKKPMEMLIKQGQVMCANRQYLDAAYMGEALIKSVYARIDNVYDSDGFYDFAEGGLKIIQKVMEVEDLPLSLKDTIWDNLLVLAGEKKYYSYGNLGTQICYTMIDYVDNANKESLFSFLIKHKIQEARADKKESYMMASRVSSFVEILSTLYEKKGKVKEIKALVQENIDIPSINNVLIKSLIEAKDFVEATKVIEKILANIAKNNSKDINQTNRESANYWKYLLTIAKLENDKEQIRALSKKLWNSNLHNDEYYLVYKSTFDANSSIWKKEIESIINYFREHKAMPDYILIGEEKWTDLLEIIKNNVADEKRYYSSSIYDYDVFEIYDKYLLPHFPEELAKLYQTYIKKEALYANERNKYYYISQKVKRFATYPNQLENAQKLLNYLVAANQNRPSFIEELNKIKI